MKNAITLSIALASLSAVGAMSEPLHAADAPAAAPAKAATSKGGKCASGKCGTDRKYTKAEVTGSSQDRLVRARDGNCGASAKGHDVPATKASALAEGTCGQ